MVPKCVNCRLKAAAISHNAVHILKCLEPVYIQTCKRLVTFTALELETVLSCIVKACKRYNEFWQHSLRLYSLELW